MLPQRIKKAVADNPKKVATLIDACLVSENLWVSPRLLVSAVSCVFGLISRLIISRWTLLRPLTQKFKFQPKWGSTFINSYSINQIDGHHNHPNKESVFFSLKRCSRATGFHSDVIAESADFGCHRQFSKQDDSSSPDEADVYYNTDLERFESDRHPFSIKILSYHVWFLEDLEMQERMEEIGDLIHLHSPHIICLQEVTPEIYAIFQNSSWWRLYQHCSVSPKMAYTKPYFCMLDNKCILSSLIFGVRYYTRLVRESNWIHIFAASEKEIVCLRFDYI